MPYTVPTAAAFKARYAPIFDAVADARINAVIAEANRSVDTTWTEGDYQPAILALTAHLLTLEGQGTSVAAQLAGFRSLTVGPLSLTRSNDAGEPGGLSSTVYGQQYLRLLGLNIAGITVADTRVT